MSDAPTVLDPSAEEEILRLPYEGETYVRLQDVVRWFLNGADAMASKEHLSPESREFIAELFTNVAAALSTLAIEESNA